MKILSILSSKKKGEDEQFQPEIGEYYICPNGSKKEKVFGNRTNDAPIKFLLSEYDVTDIIIIVSQEAKKTAFNYFVDMVKNESSNVNIVEIPYNEDVEFKSSALPIILDNINENDEMLLDATGGARNDIIHLLLVNQILTYKKIPIKSVIYSNFHTKPKQIEILDNTVDLFKVVTGLQVLISTGNVKILREYYPFPYHDTKIEAVLSALENLYDVISLCFVVEIDFALTEFNQALSSCIDTDDILFNQLIHIFRDTYSGEMDLIDLIEWCVDNAMIQQALTIYNEKLPRYLFNEEFIKYSGSKKEDKKVINDFYFEIFKDSFLTLGSSSNIINNFRELTRKEKTKEYLCNILAENYTKEGIFSDYSKGVENIKIILKIYQQDKRNTLDNKDILLMLKRKSELDNIAELEYGKNKQSDFDASIKILKTITNLPKDILSDVLGIKLTDDNVETIENFEKLLTNNSSFTVTTDITSLQEVCKDYLYIKSLRNRTNHAAEKDSTSEKVIIEYLSTKHEFKPIEEITKVVDICQVLKKATSNVRKLKK